MASRIGNGEWKLAFATSGLLDIIQWLLDLLAVGLIINEFLDPAIGVVMAAYFQLRGVSLIQRPKRLMSLLGAYAGEAFTDSVAPAWIVDVWYIYKDVKMEEAESAAIKEQAEFIQMNTRQPLNQEGVRQPIPATTTESLSPANMDGIRAPGGGMSMAA